MRRKITALGVLVAALEVGCGSRSGLLAPDSSPSGGSGGTSLGGTGGSAGTAGTAGIAGTAGVSGAGGALPDCVLSSAGAPFELLSFPEGDTDTPLFALLDQGAAGSRLAYAAISQDANFWHPELRVAELSVGPKWPDDAKLTKSPVLYGFDSHSWGLLANAPEPSSKDFALAFYHADEASPNVKPALKFRSFDSSAWQPGAEIAIDPAGSVVYDFVPGASVKGKQYADSGYAVAYRGSFDDGDSEPRVAVLDAKGKTKIGPVPVAAKEKYPGRFSDLSWTGSTYLVATPFGDCPSSPGFCSAHHVVVRALDPAGELHVTAEIAPLAPDYLPRRTALASWNGHTHLAWSEGDAPDDAPRSVRLLALDAAGAALGAPLTIAEQVRLDHGVSLSVSSEGLLLWWDHVGEPGPPSEQPGHSLIVLRHFGLAGGEIGPPIEIPATALAYGPPLSLVTLQTPRSALLSWGGLSTKGGLDVTWLARLDCQAWE